MRGKAIEVLRWIGVLPAAVVGGFAARYVGNPVGRFIISGWGRDSTLSLAFQLLVYGLSAATFVLVGALVAPRHRGIMGLVLAICMILLSLLTHILSQPHPGRTNFLHFGAETTGALLAAALLFFGRQQRTRDDVKD